MSKKCFQPDPVMEKYIRNAFLNILRVQTLGKSCTLPEVGSSELLK